MRKFILLPLLVLLPLAMYSQGAYIADGLWNTLKSSKSENTPVRIVMVMRDHVDLQALIHDFEMNNTPLATRQHLVLRMLQEKARETQAGVLDFLKENENNQKEGIHDLKTYWFANVIAVEVPVSLVWRLAERSDIEYMDLDVILKPMPELPAGQKHPEKTMIGGAEPGLLVIKANEMWRKGYTGRNRISYSIDTGVWPNHPALKDRFLANFFPLSQSWFPYDCMLPADKAGSHGTHTLGITLGLEKATNDTIGCAFNAYWICSDPVATSLATVKPLTDFMFAYEWAMNPDGDTSTVYDIPDAINNSWGYDVPTDTTLCDSYASQMFLAVEAAGIANVFSAGNEGPGAMTIGSPHHINSNIVNSFTVGALDGNQLSYPVASFSSRGPSICGGTGSLLIMPEVAAPGVDVRSSVNSTGYDYFSGTSMAGPHVTGAVILLKEAFPYLAGSEILKALYFTATDLGDPGEDNTYGMGLINLGNAFNYLSSLYTPVAPDSNRFDAEVTAVTVPGGLYYCDSMLSPVIQLHNNGDSTIHAGTVRYRTMDGIENTFPWTGSITGGQTQGITLPAIPLLTGGSKELSVWFESDTSAHETSMINNHRMQRFNFRPEAELPFIEDFENGISTQRWCINNPEQNITWDTMPAGGLLFSTFSAVMQFQGTLPANQLDEMVTPVFNLSGLDSVQLRFDVAYQNRHIALADTLRIYVSTDCGATFPFLVYKKGGTSLQTYDTVTPNFIPWKASQWRAEYIDLSAFAGNPEVLIKFTGHNKRGNNLFLDNIKVYSGPEPVFVKELVEETWKVWPNPATTVLNVRFDKHLDEECLAEIVSITGTTVMRSSIPAGYTGNYPIDISSLSAGIYLVQAYSENTHFSSRFIKTNLK